MLRIVLDTNVVVSGLLWHGPSRLLLDSARNGHVALFTSPALIAELADVLARPKFERRLADAEIESDGLVVGYASLAIVLTPAEIEPTILDDPDDDAVLACALTAQVEAIVSGDRHLLALGEYRKIVILTAADMIARIAADNRPR